MTYKFIDSAEFTIEAGTGGAGAVAFRRELYVPKGGPAGGDGGRGGNVYLVGTPNLHTLFDIQQQKVFHAEHGQPGRSKNQHGRKGQDLEILLPLGTMVYNAQSNQLLVDIVEADKRFLIARGGKGGRGNKRFVNAQRKVPRLYEAGDHGERITVRCELKVLSDIGLIGLPNAGKSTLLSVLTNRKPEIGNYPFTTLTPQLGITSIRQQQSFVISDLPGLIKGAHEGKGLGFQFLKHAERCKILAPVIDVSDEMILDAVKAPWKIIFNELQEYKINLLKKVKLVIINKIDLLEDLTIIAKIKTLLPPDLQVVTISALRRQNLQQLKNVMWKLIQDNLQQQAETLSNAPDFKLYEFQSPVDTIQITATSDHSWELNSKVVEAWCYKYPLTTFDNWLFLQKKFHSLGVDKKLAAAGLAEGDEVTIGQKFRFHWVNGKLA